MKNSYKTVFGNFETIVDFFNIHIAIAMLITMPFHYLKTVEEVELSESISCTTCWP